VRIPYPLSSFYPVVITTQPQPAAPDANNNSDTSDKQDEVSKTEGSKSITTYIYSGGFGLSQMRDDIVELVNEAGDAIWKNSRSSPATHTDSDDL
jgi:hypothetical protein